MSNKKYILIADDDKIYTKIFVDQLINAGYDAFAVHNGLDLLAESHKRTPDLIICDLIMPLEDGFLVIAQLKADLSLEGVPIVVMTGLSQDEDRKKVMKLGARDYLVKSSLTIPDLVQKVKNYL